MRVRGKGPAGCRRSQGSPKLVAATDTFHERCDLIARMTTMSVESTGCGRKEIGPQDRYFLPDLCFTPSHDRDAYRVNPVRVPIHLSRNENCQVLSPFVRFCQPSPKTEVERGGNRWNANTKRVETGGTDSTLFHLFPPVSTCFHLKTFFGEKLYFNCCAPHACAFAPDFQLIPTCSSLFQRIFF